MITAQIHDDAWYAEASLSGSSRGRQPAFEVGLPRPLVGSVLDSNGVNQFGITQSATPSSDGSIATTLTVAFSVPAQPSVSNTGIPLVGLDAQVNTAAGELSGGQTLYYGVSAIDADGAESGLSFAVRASIPAATNTNQVTLTSLSFSSTATGFNVYRGSNPVQLLRVAENVAISSQFTDAGAVPLLKGPPDYNYDHANFYWRIEMQPAENVDIHSSTTVGNSALNMLPNEYNGATVIIATGKGAGQERTVAGNTSTTITTTTAWAVEPDTTSSFVIAESTWQFGASSNASPVYFVVPNREGLTIQVSGRAANVRDDESAFELSPLTRWRISGGGGDGFDVDIPGKPTFGLFPTGQGEIEALGIGFESLANTRSIAAGTLTIAYWNELGGPSLIALSAAMGAADLSFTVNTPASAEAGDLVQIDGEIMVVQQAVSGGTTFQVARESHGSVAEPHDAQAGVYFLQKRTFIMPFARDFFGSPASGSYAYAVAMPDVRIGAAEFFVTNSRGDSPVAMQAFSGTTDLGLRTLSGGQLTIQIEGPLAIQTNAAPPLMVESAHSVRDIYAVVSDPPTGAPVTLQVTQNGQPYCELTIPTNATVSNVVDGFALGPLQAKAQIGLDITSVVQTANSAPGRDLTVTIRL